MRMLLFAMSAIIEVVLSQKISPVQMPLCASLALPMSMSLGVGVALGVLLQVCLSLSIFLLLVLTCLGTECEHASFDEEKLHDDGEDATPRTSQVSIPMFYMNGVA